MVNWYNLLKFLVLYVIRGIVDVIFVFGKKFVVVNVLNLSYCRFDLERENGVFVMKIKYVMFGVRFVDMGSRVLVYGVFVGKEIYGFFLNDCYVEM